MTAILKTYLDDFFEEKATGQKKIGVGVPLEKFTESQWNRILFVLRKIWGKQLDNVTLERVRESLQLKDLPPGFGDELENTLNDWIENEYIPAYRKSIIYAANGDRIINGMMTHINDVANGNLIFNPTTERLNQIIQDNAVDLAVNLKNNQVAALKNTLSKALENDWGLKKTHEMMKKTITLTDQESKWLLSYEEKRRVFWQKHFDREFPDMKPNQFFRAVDRNVSIDVNRRQGLYLSNRKDRIIRTELIRAREAANIESINQSLDAGLIDAGFKQWNRNNIIDNWQSSVMYDGKRIGVNESFFVKFGRPENTTMLTGMYPGEINDLCNNEYYVTLKKGGKIWQYQMVINIRQRT